MLAAGCRPARHWSLASREGVARSARAGAEWREEKHERDDTPRSTTTPHAPCSAAAVRTTEVISRAAAAGAAERRRRLGLGYMLNCAARLRRSAASSQLASRTRRSSHFQQRIGGGAGRLRCGALHLAVRNTRTYNCRDRGVSSGGSCLNSECHEYIISSLGRRRPH